MANPSKAKGTKYENEVLALLRDIWPAADRAKTGNFSCDIVGVPFTCETKHRKAWAFPDWVRKIRTLGPRWAIFAGHGDRRSLDSIGDVVLFPRTFAIELLRAWSGTVRGAKTLREIAEDAGFPDRELARSAVTKADRCDNPACGLCNYFVEPVELEAGDVLEVSMS